VFGLRRPPHSGDRDQNPGQDDPRSVLAPPPARGGSNRRSHKLPGETVVPAYTPSIAVRSIDGHLVRNGREVYAWYRLASHRWSFR
jgi:hypothetical protein